MIFAHFISLQNLPALLYHQTKATNGPVGYSSDTSGLFSCILLINGRKAREDAA